MRVALICNTMSAFPLVDWLNSQGVLVGIGFKEQKTEFSDNLSVVCKQRGLSMEGFRKENLTQQLSFWIRTIGADVVLVLGFSYKIPKEVLNLPQFGFFNIHYGKLPKYGGSFPVFWQIRNQEKEGTLTIHKMNENFDAGDIAIEIPIAINPNLTYGILDTNYGYLSIQGSFLLIESLLKNTLRLKPQNANKQPFYKKPVLKDLIIDWQKMNAHEVLALIKASNPWNRGAFARINGIDVRIIEGEVRQAKSIKNGEILNLHANGIEVSCIRNTAIDIKVMHSQFGYLSGANLGVFGIKNGDIFEKI